MFQAIGIGYSRSLPSAAALNWVLKDGLGRLSRCIYTASLALAFDTNLKDRLESIINIWIQLGYVPSPAEVSKTEGIDFLWGKGRELLPIRIGCLNPKRRMPKLSMMTLRSLKDEDFYFICMESVNSRSVTRDHEILLCLREGAGFSDVLMGLLQGLLLDVIGWEDDLEEPRDSWDSVVRNWFRLMEESKGYAQKDLDLFIDKMSGLGWACKNILLSTEEQARYSFVAD